MSGSRLRRHIAVEAGKLMYQRVETEYFTAKRKAAARLGVNLRRQPQNLPSNREIRDEIQALARLHEGPERAANLADMRLAGLRMMRLLLDFQPRLIGSVVTGHTRAGSDIDVHVFSDNVSAVTDVLDLHNYQYDVERKRVIKHNTERVFTHVHIYDRYTYELTVYTRDQINYTFRSSITGKTIERASAGELEKLIRAEHPEIDTDADGEEAGTLDRYLLWSLLLPPLEAVKQSPRWHPEGDALYHSLQAFEIARHEAPYDQELIAAALLHDVGKAIDPQDHVCAALEALEGTLSPREQFLIAHHMDALAYHERTLGTKLRQRLETSEWFDDLMTLRDIDDRARDVGVEVCTVEEAIEFLRDLEDEFAEP